MRKYGLARETAGQARRGSNWTRSVCLLELGAKLEKSWEEKYKKETC
jgi:hypothetical protein